MAAKPFIARTGLCSLAAGVAATLALAVGTLNDAAARIGFYADTTVSAEKLAMVVGGVSGPTYTRSGSAVNVSVPGSLTATSIVDSGLTSGRVTFATTGGALTDSANLTYGSGKVTIADGTASSSTSTGALVLSGSGGIGVGGNAWIGGTINVAGTATVGAGSGNALAILAGAAGSNRFTRVYSGAGTSSANLRWDIGADGTAESGSNAGSPFLVVAYSDSGAFIDSPISIVRASGGTMTLSRPVSMSSTLAVTGGAAMVQTTGLSQASFTIDDGSGSGGQSRLLLFTNSGAGSKTNWRIGAQITLNHTLEIGHSTAVGGSTYTTDLTIDNSGNVAITATTASTSKTTGAHVVAGGLGVGGAINAGGPISIAQTGSNNFLGQGTGWIWTSDGTSGGTVRGGIYAQSGGTITLFGGSTITDHLHIDSSGNVLVGVGTTSLKTTDAGTNTRPNTLLIGHNTSGTPASGFGSTLRFQAQTTTLADQDLAMVESLWTTPTHASRTGRVAYSVFDSVGARECLRMEANGSAAAIGLYGASAVAQYATTGTATGFTAGAGTTVTHLSTFTGNTGSTAYTIGDVVRALKLIGAIAS